MGWWYDTLLNKWKELTEGTELHRLHEGLNARSLDLLIDCFPSEVQYCRDPTTADDVRFSFVHRLVAKLLEVQKEDPTKLLDVGSLVDFVNGWSYRTLVSRDEYRDLYSAGSSNFFYLPRFELWSERCEKAANNVIEQRR